MRQEDDFKLLKMYAEHGSQEAFSELVGRHLKLVYSVCLRETENPATAEDATQAVFLILAEKARSMREGVVVAGWLFNTARYAGKNARSIDHRRSINEKKLVDEMARQIHYAEVETWGEVEPHIDDALARLKAKDREAVLLRFFQEKSYKEVAAAQGTAEDSARMRVTRALEKLRGHLGRAGVTVSVAVLSGMLSERAVHAAPAACAAKVALMISSLSGTGATKFGAGMAGLKAREISQGVLKTMFMEKVRVGAVVAGLVLIGAVYATRAISSAVADGAREIPALAAPDQSTPEAAVQTLLQTMRQGDVASATKCVLGGKPFRQLASLKGSLDDVKLTIVLPSSLSSSVNGNEATVQIGGGHLQLGDPAFENDPLQGMVDLRLQDGSWKVVPRDSGSWSSNPNGRDSIVEELATLLIASPETLRGLVHQAAAPLCFLRTKQLCMDTLKLAGAHQGRLATSDAKFQTDLLPYAASPAMFHCLDDQDSQVSYSFNDNLKDIPLSQITAPESTVLVYEGRNGKLDFRHDGRAMVGFVDGNVRPVTQDEAGQLKVTPTG